MTLTDYHPSIYLLSIYSDYSVLNRDITFFIYHINLWNFTEEILSWKITKQSDYGLIMISIICLKQSQVTFHGVKQIISQAHLIKLPDIVPDEIQFYIILWNFKDKVHSKLKLSMLCVLFQNYQYRFEK